MKPTLALRQAQRLSLTPELRQALGLLQLSAAELGARVQEALEQNVLLERGDEASVQEAGAPPSGNPAEPLTADPETAVDWDSAELTPASGWDEGENPRPEAAEPGGQSLKDYLLWQLELARLSPADAAIGAAIIDSLNDDGYLQEPLEEIRLGLADSDAAPEADEMQAMLHRIQAFDPSGVAARDLKECLLLQLRQDADLGTAGILAAVLVENHLERLAIRDYDRLCRELRVNRGELDDAVAIVQSLHPRPGSTVSGPSGDYVVPDVLVSRADGIWRVELNPEAAPRIRVNPGYAAALRRRSETSSDLSQQLQEARWLVRSLKMRNETLLRVAHGIIRRQTAFLDRGEEAMQPLLMKDMAEELELHESTISRVVANKYMATPRGTLAFRHFFSGELTTEDGGACSATAIRAMIKKLVAQEDPQAPLSDNHISRELLGRGIRVARRTVAKYRESLTIPPAHERKRLESR